MHAVIYFAVHSQALAHRRHARLSHGRHHLHTCVKLFCCAVGWTGWDNDLIGAAFARISGYMSWYVAAHSHAVAIKHHATLHSHSRVLAHIRHLCILCSGKGWVGIITSLALRSHALRHRLYAL